MFVHNIVTCTMKGSDEGLRTKNKRLRPIINKLNYLIGEAACTGFTLYATNMWALNAGKAAAQIQGTQWWSFFAKGS